MPTQALRLRAGLLTGDLEPCELEPDAAAALARAKAEIAPAVYILRNEDLPPLRQHRDLVIDRGNKHHAKALSSLLLGHDRIPLIQGGYAAPGQLVRSVRTLLDHAVRRSERNVFVVGAPEPVFAELWAGATGPVDAGGTAAQTPVESPPLGASAAASDPVAAPAGSLFELLPRLLIPENVSRQYVGESVEVQLVHQLVVRAARRDEPVLIVGDTGTGKEVVARLIHAQSTRRNEAFTPVNCGAIPRELFESELFGKVKGAFTDAKESRAGLWRITRQGTLFLDEIAELSLDHQVKILRVLDQGEVLPVGGEERQPVKARVITATNRDLFAMVRAGEFREDLYYRLRAFTVRTPALRDHPQDIPLLARHFWTSLTRDAIAELPVDVVRELQSHRWPGNARELKLVLSSVLGLFGSDQLTARHVRAVFELEGQVRVDVAKPPGPGEIGLHRAECLRHLNRAGEVLRAAKVCLRPMVGDTRPDDATVARVRAELGGHVNELELLCLRPLLFYSETAFSIVHRLKGKLVRCFRLLESDAGQVRSYWQSDLEGEFQHASSTIFREVERVRQAM